MKARGGWTLVEVLMAVALLGVVVGLTGPVFRTLISDVPQATAAVEANCAVRRMLSRLRRDVDVARLLPTEAGPRKAGSRRILIDTPEGLICYEFGEKAVTRRVTAQAGAGGEPRETIWRTPRARIEWQLRRARGRPVGIELRTAIEYPTPAGAQRKLANSHLFFLAAPGGGGKAR